MKKKVLTFLFIGIFIWGILSIFSRSDSDLKNVGDVVLINNDIVCKLSGDKISKRYKDDIVEFDEPDLNLIRGSLVTVKMDDLTATEEGSGLGVRYKGDFIDKEETDMVYTIYDENCNELYKTKTLKVEYKKDSECYVSIDVKWGRVKNYVCMRYFFRIET